MRDLFDFLIRILMRIEMLDAANPKWNKKLRHRIITEIIDDKEFRKKIDHVLLNINCFSFIDCQGEISLMRSNVAIKLNAWAVKSKLWENITNETIKNDLNKLMFIGKINIENCFPERHLNGIEIRKFYE